MLFLSGSLRAGGKTKSITPWRLQTNSNATSLQTALLSSLTFPGVVAKQRCSISPLHTRGSRKSAAPPFHFVVIFAPPLSCSIFLLPSLEGEMVQKRSINNSNCAKRTIAVCILCGAKVTTTNTALTTTYVNNKPLMHRRTNFYIVSHHLTNIWTQLLELPKRKC